MKPEMTRTEYPNDDTRNRLIEIARRHFAEKGFRGTSVRAITREADCNVASVNYYFGSKQNLYVEAFRSVIGRLRDIRVDALNDLLAQEGEITLEAVLLTFARVFYEPLLENGGGRCFMGLMHREIDEKRLPGNIFLEEGVRPIANTMHKALSRVYPGFEITDSFFCTQSVVAQLMFAFQVKNFVEASGSSNWPTLDLEKVIEHVVQFSAAGIRTYVQESGGGAQ